jgi:phosphate transport system substrate-binding protein
MGMRLKILSSRLGAGVLVSLVALTGCGGNNDELSGKVTADGSSTVGPITSVAAELYAEDQPKVKVSVSERGTSGGFERFCNGEIDISDASRPIKDTEQQKCQVKNINYAELLIANDAITIVVPKSNNFVDCLTTAQLKKIWDSGSTVKSWRDVDPSFPNRPITLFGPGTASGTFQYFTQVINGEEARSRTDYSASEQDNVLVQGIAGDENALGYFGFSHYAENDDTLKAVKVDAGDGCIEPSVKNAQNGTYKPLSRPLFIYISDKAIKREEVSDFVDFYIDRIDEIGKEAKVVPLTAKQKSTLADEYAALKKKA